MQDNFNSGINAANYDSLITAPGVIAADAGRVRVETGGAGGSAFLRWKVAEDMTGTRWFVEAKDLQTSYGSSFEFRLYIDDNNWWRFALQNGAMQGYSPGANLGTIAIDPVAHLFWAYFHDTVAATVKLQVSPDRETWSTLWSSAAYNANVTSMRPAFGVWDFGGDAISRVGYFDNLNTMGATPITATLTGVQATASVGILTGVLASDLFSFGGTGATKAAVLVWDAASNAWLADKTPGAVAGARLWRRNSGIHILPI